MDECTVAHYFIPREGVVQTYVFAKNGKKISDLFSFYIKRCNIKPESGYKHEYFTQAYAFYNISTSGRLSDGLSDMLHRAKEAGCDSYSCLDTMEENLTGIFERLKLYCGNRYGLRFYLFNWRMPRIHPCHIGMALI